MSADASPGRPGAFQRPGRIRDGVDFSLMYGAHDAFVRDLDRLAAALRAGRAGPAVLAGWQTFTRQLRVHHTAEDAALWPALHARTAREEEREVLAAMEREHAVIDPLLARVDAALGRGDGAAAAVHAAELAASLTAHMDHEEQAALPLVARYLGRAGWDRFGAELRRTHGVRGGSEFIPWMLDGTRPADRSRLLALFPAPVRIAYRAVFRRRYDRVRRWIPAG